MATFDLGKVVPEKGIDYFTNEDIAGIENDIKTDLNFDNTIQTINGDISNLQTNKADKTEIPDTSSYITKDVQDLTYYYKSSETYTKTEIDNKVSSVYKYKGSVATYNDLPSQNLTIGDTYNVESDGSNYSWNGTSWDKLGGDIDLSDYYTKSQTNTLLGGKQNTIDGSHKLSADNVDDTNATNKFVSSSEKTTWNGKLDSSKVKATNSTTSGDVYDVTYINSLVGDINSALDAINGEVI